MDVRRCPWAGTSGPMCDYHDREWGVPTRDDRDLFELLVLGGAQAGLDPARAAALSQADLDAALGDPGIIRHRGKVASVVTNAQAFLHLAGEHGSFAEYLWSWTGGRPVVNRWEHSDQVPVSTPLSDALSRDLRKRGFRFVGPTIAYAYLQATGVVLDHLTGCYRWEQLAARR